MDPEESPFARVGRTFWAAWAYITTSVVRLLRPEINTAPSTDVQPGRQDDEEGVTRETASTKGEEEHPDTATSLPVTDAHGHPAAVPWETCEVVAGGDDKEANVYSVQYCKVSEEGRGLEGEEVEPKQDMGAQDDDDDEDDDDDDEGDTRQVHPCRDGMGPERDKEATEIPVSLEEHVSRDESESTATVAAPREKVDETPLTVKAGELLTSDGRTAGISETEGGSEVYGSEEMHNVARAPKYSQEEEMMEQEVETMEQEVDGRGDKDTLRSSGDPDAEQVEAEVSMTTVAEQPAQVSHDSLTNQEVPVSVPHGPSEPSAHDPHPTITCSHEPLATITCTHDPLPTITCTQHKQETHPPATAALEEPATASLEECVDEEGKKQVLVSGESDTHVLVSGESDAQVLVSGENDAQVLVSGESDAQVSVLSLTCPDQVDSGPNLSDQQELAVDLSVEPQTVWYDEDEEKEEEEEEDATGTPGREEHEGEGEDCATASTNEGRVCELHGGEERLVDPSSKHSANDKDLCEKTEELEDENDQTKEERPRDKMVEEEDEIAEDTELMKQELVCENYQTEVEEEPSHSHFIDDRLSEHNDFKEVKDLEVEQGSVNEDDTKEAKDLYEETQALEVKAITEQESVHEDNTEEGNNDKHLCGETQILQMEEETKQQSVHGDDIYEPVTDRHLCAETEGWRRELVMEEESVCVEDKLEPAEHKHLCEGTEDLKGEEEESVYEEDTEEPAEGQHVCGEGREGVCEAARDGVCEEGREGVCEEARDGVCEEAREGVCEEARDNSEEDDEGREMGEESAVDMVQDAAVAAECVTAIIEQGSDEDATQEATDDEHLHEDATQEATDDEHLHVEIQVLKVEEVTQQQPVHEQDANERVNNRHLCEETETLKRKLVVLEEESVYEEDTEEPAEDEDVCEEANDSSSEGEDEGTEMGEGEREESAVCEKTKSGEELEDERPEGKLVEEEDAMAEGTEMMKQALVYEKDQTELEGEQEESAVETLQDEDVCEEAKHSSSEEDGEGRGMGEGEMEGRGMGEGEREGRGMGEGEREGRGMGEGDLEESAVETLQVAAMAAARVTAAETFSDMFVADLLLQMAGPCTQEMAANTQETMDVVSQVTDIAEDQAEEEPRGRKAEVSRGEVEGEGRAAFDHSRPAEESEDEGVSIDPDDSEVQDVHEVWHSKPDSDEEEDEEAEADFTEDFTSPVVEAGGVSLDDAEMEEMEEVEATETGSQRETTGTTTTEEELSFSSKAKDTQSYAANDPSPDICTSDTFGISIMADSKFREEFSLSSSAQDTQSDTQTDTLRESRRELQESDMTAESSYTDNDPTPHTCSDTDVITDNDPTPHTCGDAHAISVVAHPEFEEEISRMLLPRHEHEELAADISDSEREQSPLASVVVPLEHDRSLHECREADSDSGEETDPTGAASGGGEDGAESSPGEMVMERVKYDPERVKHDPDLDSRPSETNIIAESLHLGEVKQEVMQCEEAPADPQAHPDAIMQSIRSNEEILIPDTHTLGSDRETLTTDTHTLESNQQIVTSDKHTPELGYQILTPDTHTLKSDQQIFTPHTNTQWSYQQVPHTNTQWSYQQVLTPGAKMGEGQHSSGSTVEPQPDKNVMSQSEGDSKEEIPADRSEAHAQGIMGNVNDEDEEHGESWEGLNTDETKMMWEGPNTDETKMMCDEPADDAREILKDEVENESESVMDPCADTELERAPKERDRSPATQQENMEEDEDEALPEDEEEDTGETDVQHVVTMKVETGEATDMASRSALKRKFDSAVEEEKALKDEPDITEPDITEPDITEPDITEPDITEPDITEPDITEPLKNVPVEDSRLKDEPDITEPLKNVPVEDSRLQVEVFSLDCSAQKSRIAVKNPLVRPPTDPRALLNLPSLEPTPTPRPTPQPGSPPGHGEQESPQGRPHKRAPAFGVPMGGVGVMGGIGVKLPGLGAGFPVLRKTHRETKEEEQADSLPPQKFEREQSQTEGTTEEPHQTPSKPKWTPPKHAIGMGNPFMMAELKGKLKKTPKE